MNAEKPKKDDSQTNQKTQTIIRIIITLAFLAILIFITITLISGRGLNFDWITNLFSSNEPIEPVEELFFNIGRNRAFADIENAVAAVGSLGIQVINYGGVETLRESLPMSTPVINSQGNYAIAFDIGGTEARVFNSNGIVASVSTNGPIVSASINRNRWFTIDSQEGEGFRGTTSVYNNDGNLVYRVSLSSGYILSSALSFDNSRLAILNLTDFGSRVTFYNDLSKEYDDGFFDFPNGLIFDIRFLENGDLLAVSTQSLILIDPYDAWGWEIFSFSGMRLGGYAIGEDYIALHLLDFGIGHRGKLIIIDLFGNLFGEIATERELISMSLGRDSLSVMFSDGPVLLDRSLNVIPTVYDITSASGVSQILTLSNDTTLVAGDRFALVLK